MLLKAHLDWLDGTPVAQSPGQIEWRTRPKVGAPTRTIMVDRELVRQSQATMTTLANNFPHAMPRLVSDLSLWRRNLTSLLDCLKAAIHEGLDLSVTTSTPDHTLTKAENAIVQHLRRQHPTLQPLLRRIIWSGWSNPAARSSLIRWISQHAEWIECHLALVNFDQAVENVLLIGDLVESDGDDCLMFLRPALSDPKSFQCPTTGLRQEISWFVARLRAWRSPRSRPPQPRQVTATPYGPRIVSFLRWIAEQDRPIRQQAIQLAKQVLSYPIVQEWQTAWDGFRTATHRIIRSLCQTARHASALEFHSEACRLSYALEDEFKQDPLPFPTSEILTCIERISTAFSPRYSTALHRLLSAIPTEQADGTANWDRWALRLAFLCEARNVEDEPKATRYLELAAKFIQGNNPHLYRFRPWEMLATAWKERGEVLHSLRTTLFDVWPELSWVAFFDVLTRIADDPQYNSRRNDAIALLLKLSGTVDKTCDRFAQVAPTGLLEDGNYRQFQTAGILETAGFTFVELLELVGPAGQVEHSQLISLQKVHRKFVEAGWTNLVPSLLRMKHGPEVCRLTTRFHIANASEERLAFVPHPTSSSLPDWATYLPSRLHPTIATYCAVFPDCRKRVQRVLEKQFVDREKLQTEIVTLERFQTTRPYPLEEKLQRRLNNLTQRLNHPLPVSEATLERLKLKLDEALLTDVFRDANERIESVLVRVIGGSHKLSELSAPHLALVRGIMDLDEPYKAYGLRLLRKKWGQATWNLLDEPANKRFLAGLRSRGIHTSAWLNSKSRQVRGEQSQTWTLAFESDELELLLMGYHFGTCLSPDGCNFFSAVANAIDVNKRVLYARDSRGNVVGRCLLAIGDAGTILTYRPYCHDDALNFDQRVADFATELAAEMGTVISHTDHVSPLVAPEWYDDGAYDLGNSIAGEQSPLRVAIRTATELTLIPSIERALSPQGLTESMLELIVELPELSAQPQLIRPLLPLIERNEQRLGIAALIATARLADAAGINNVARRLVMRRGSEWVLRRITAQGGLYGDAATTLELLTKHHPSSALRILRATRPTSVRHDDEETDYRRSLLADCYTALGRNRLAAELKAKKTNR